MFYCINLRGDDDGGGGDELILWMIDRLKCLRPYLQSTITCSKRTIETLEHGVKYVQS